MDVISENMIKSTCWLNWNARWEGILLMYRFTVKNNTSSISFSFQCHLLAEVFLKKWTRPIVIRWLSSVYFFQLIRNSVVLFLCLSLMQIENIIMKIGAVKEEKLNLNWRQNWLNLCDKQLDWVACCTSNEICSWLHQSMTSLGSQPCAPSCSTGGWRTWLRTAGFNGRLHVRNRQRS